MEHKSDQSTNNIGILIFEDMEELDAVGPWEVLAAWADQHPQDGWAVHLISRDGNSVRCAKGMVIGATCSIDTAPPLEVLIHPGGDGTLRLLEDESHLEWVRKQRSTVPLMTSVCTGALVYAAAGLLKGRPATTWWGAVDRLAEIDPSTDVKPTARYVDDDDVITASGVSAGIDMALHLVIRFAGKERAKEVRKYIQYDPQPPV